MLRLVVVWQAQNIYIYRCYKSDMMMLMNRYPSWNSNIIATQWGAVISTDFEMVSTYALPQFQDMAKSKWIICSDLHRCVCSTGKHQGVGSWFDKIFRSGKHKAIPVPQHFQLMVLEFTCHMKYHAHIYIYIYECKSISKYTGRGRE